MDWRRNLLITDFDLSHVSPTAEKLEYDRVYSSRYCGTEYYMAPEVEACKHNPRDKCYGPKIDFFSFGIVLYELSWTAYNPTLKYKDVSIFPSRIFRCRSLADNALLPQSSYIAPENMRAELEYFDGLALRSQQRGKARERVLQSPAFAGYCRRVSSGAPCTGRRSTTMRATICL